MRRKFYNASELEKFAIRMRGSPAKHEALFIERLRLANITSYVFQVRIGFYIADFVFPSQMLIIELDGPLHDVDHDRKRDAFLRAAGFAVWRINNCSVAEWPLYKINAHMVNGRNYAAALDWANDRFQSAVTFNNHMKQERERKKRNKQKRTSAVKQSKKPAAQTKRDKRGITILQQFKSLM